MWLYIQTVTPDWAWLRADSDLQRFLASLHWWLHDEWQKEWHWKGTVVMIVFVYTEASLTFVYCILYTINNNIFLKKGRPIVLYNVMQNIFWPIWGLISCTGVQIRRWGLLAISYTQNKTASYFMHNKLFSTCELPHIMHVWGNPQ